jgi:hypothetical protein
MNDIDSTIVPAPVFKPIDGPWIGLLVLSIFILVASVFAMIVLYFLWRYYQRLTEFYNKSYILSNPPTGKRQIPVQIEEQQPKPYEIQVYILNVKQTFSFFYFVK